MYTNLTKFIATAFAGIAPDEIEMILREVNKPFIRIIPRVPGGEIVVCERACFFPCASSHYRQSCVMFAQLLRRMCFCLMSPQVRRCERSVCIALQRQKATAREIFKALDKEGTGRITTKQLFDRLEPDMDIVVDKSSFQAMCIEVRLCIVSQFTPTVFYCLSSSQAGVDPARGITAEGFVKMFYEFM